MDWLDAHIEAAWENGETRVPVLVLGALDRATMVCVRGDSGEFTSVPMSKLRTSWRFDESTDRWIDLNHPEAADGDDADV